MDLTRTLLSLGHLLYLYLNYRSATIASYWEGHRVNHLRRRGDIE